MKTTIKIITFITIPIWALPFLIIKIIFFIWKDIGEFWDKKIK